MADLLAVLYFDILNVDPQTPEAPGRDRYFQSKGHAAAIYYACLALKGFFPRQWLEEFCQDGHVLGGHVTSHSVPGVEFSTGSLGHALSVAAGVALSAHREDSGYNIYTMVSDGEMNEGSNWEALLFAAHHGLNNLCVIIDYNRIQSFGRTDSVLTLEPLGAKVKAFGWDTHEIDGHDHQQIQNVLELFQSRPTDRPFCVVAHTVKGRGVDFMEDELLWHYRPPSAEQYEESKKQLLEGSVGETDAR